MSGRYTDDVDTHSDHGSGSGSGSGTRVNSPLSSSKEFSRRNNPLDSISSTSMKDKLNLGGLALIFTLSIYLLFLALTTAHSNNAMLNSLKPYAVDVANVTNKTWGYGDMPVKMNTKPSKLDHSHHAGKGGSETSTALDPEDTTILYANMFDNSEEFPVTIFPTTSDPLDEERPDEVVTFERNFLVKKHVNTIVQYNRRISSNSSYRSSHTTCAVQGFFPPYQSLINNKTLISSPAPIQIHLLDTPPDGPWWAGKDFIKNGNYTLHSNYTWNTRTERKQLLGEVSLHPGMNWNSGSGYEAGSDTRDGSGGMVLKGGTFECPPIVPGNRKTERIAVEFSCKPGPEEDSCHLEFDAVMKYPIVLFEVTY